MARFEFASALGELDEALRVKPFRFLGPAAVGSCVAACRVLLTCLWEDPGFWQVYAGECLPHLDQSGPAAPLRESFRRWLFHLDGAWSAEFRDFVNEAQQGEFGANFVQLFSDASYIVGGLMSHDDAAEVRVFVEIIRSLLSSYNPLQLDERGCAGQLVRKLELRPDVFTEEEIHDLAAMFDQSVEQALLDPYLDFSLDHEPALDQPGEESEEDSDEDARGAGPPNLAVWDAGPDEEEPPSPGLEVPDLNEDVEE